MDAAAYLQTPEAIRDRCAQLFDLACRGELEHFACDLDRLPAAADYVLGVIQTHYPDLAVPFHSRWRHFEVVGQSRLETLEPQLSQLSPLEQARLKFDLAVTSVLLDAGAGADWRYREPGTGLEFGRSEGLAIASFHGFSQGLFSSQPESPLQADAAGLEGLSPEALADAFQVGPDNPLVGVAGRVNLLQKLGIVITQYPDLFGVEQPRPGGLVDYLVNQASDGSLPAPVVLRAILQGLGSIWPGRLSLDGVPLGDVWPHPALPDTGPGSQLVPFHKLSQWLTYSLLEPLMDLGLTITDLDALTGLAEYRNGGLFIDLGVIVPRHGAIVSQPHPPDSTVVVEWRALTVMLLDRTADQIRKTLGLSPKALPLAKVLQGGTWTAGRHIAQEKRPGGPPPIQIISDGTVF
ncbi:DUF1688 domain-containing protein [filamentous cyanobacterium CCP5]|nr:DUF1688 domain-containing protein [filamentous cyanobacterium CCP5]